MDWEKGNGAKHLEIRDLDNACGDVECCGGSWPVIGIYLAGRDRWVGLFNNYEKAERMRRLLKRWNVV